MIEQFNFVDEDEFFSRYVLTDHIVGILHDISTSIPNNKKSYFIAGPFGSGKTSLLKTLNLLCLNRGDVDPHIGSTSISSKFHQIMDVFNQKLIAPCVIDLTTYSPKESLQSIIQGEILKQFPGFVTKNGEVFGSKFDLDLIMEASEYDGLLILVDELAIFLNSRNREQSLTDFAFLLHLAEIAKDNNIVAVFTINKSLFVTSEYLPYSDLALLRSNFEVFSLHLDVIGVFDETVELKPRPKQQAPRALAKILTNLVNDEDLEYYLDTRGITGKTLLLRVLDLCVSEDPEKILGELLSLTQLRRIGEDLQIDILGAENIADLRRNILGSLGFIIPKTEI